MKILSLTNMLKINIISANSQFTKMASLLLKNIASISGKNNSGLAVGLTNLPKTLHISNAI